LKSGNRKSEVGKRKEDGIISRKGAEAQRGKAKGDCRLQIADFGMGIAEWGDATPHLNPLLDRGGEEGAFGKRLKAKAKSEGAVTDASNGRAF
jgi:hypothetical protein